nr:hypothetical protein [uncultured Noviherbaspirillum sp.]
MSLSLWASLAALALPAAALAQQGRPAHPAGADAPVPLTSYVSAFTGYKSFADEAALPTQVWRTANQEVANAGVPGMQMAPHGAHRPEAPSPDPHAGHGAHRHPEGK